MLENETKWTVARQLNASGARRYIVWLTRAGATALFEFEAASASEAKAKARAELAHVEKILSAI